MAKHSTHRHTQTHTHTVAITEENSPKKSPTQEKIFSIFLYVALLFFHVQNFTELAS